MKSCIGIFYQLIVRDKNGKIVRKTRFKRSKSFVLQFLQLLEVQMYRSVDVSMKRDVGTMIAVADFASNFDAEAAITDTTKGILVGTGTTPPTNIDYNMETLIAHGTGATQLSYGATSKTTTVVVGANVDFILTRTFNNGSGNTIHVTEVGIITLIGATPYYGLMLHDTFTAVPVLNGQTLTVNYTFRTTV